MQWSMEELDELWTLIMPGIQRYLKRTVFRVTAVVNETYEIGQQLRDVRVV